MSTAPGSRISDDEVAALPLSTARSDLLGEILATPRQASRLPELARTGRRTPRWALAAAAAAAVAAVVVVPLVLLGGDDDPAPAGPGPSVSDSAPTAAPVAAGLDELQVRTVQDFDASGVCDQPPVPTDPTLPEVACDGSGTSYTLDPAVIVGGVVSAKAEIPYAQVQWAVAIQLDAPGTERFAALSRELVGTPRMFALVLDGEVLSAPTVSGVITGGTLQVSGDFTEATATALAGRLTPG